MSGDAHFAGLERMYVAAPINRFYRPTIRIEEGRATIEMEVEERHFHAAGAVHGSVSFKMLDDSAFFAANSLEREVLVLTSSFTTYFLRPVSSGGIRAEGRVVSRSRSRFLAEAVVTDADGREIARGSGVFVRSRLELEELPGYASGPSEDDAGEG